MKKLLYIILLFISTIGIGQQVRSFSEKLMFKNVPNFNANSIGIGTLRTLNLDAYGNVVSTPYFNPSSITPPTLATVLTEGNATGDRVIWSNATYGLRVGEATNYGRFTYIGSNIYISRNNNNEALSLEAGKIVFYNNAGSNTITYSASSSILKFPETLTTERVIPVSVNGQGADVLGAINLYGNYKEYAVRLAQAGSAAPTATLSYDNIAGTESYTRTSTGTYTLSNSSSVAYLTDKVLITVCNAGTGFVTAQRATNQTITINTYNAVGVLSDDIIRNCTLIIRQYP